MKKNNITILLIFVFMMSMLIGCGNVNNNEKTEGNTAQTINVKNDEKVKNNINVKNNKNIKNNINTEDHKNIKNNINNVENESQIKEKAKEEITETEKQQKEDVNKDNNIKEEKNIGERTEVKDHSQKENNENTVEGKEDSEIIPEKETGKENNNEVEKLEKEKFTLIIAKDAKGYTGKDKEILAEKELEIKDNTNAMTYLRDNFDMKEKGGFIYEIMEVHNIYPIPSSQKTEEQKKNKVLGIDWFVYLNGKKTSVGANDVYPENGDELFFDFHEWDKREFAPEE